MDTKWKRSKGIAGALCLFAGVYLLCASGLWAADFLWENNGTDRLRDAWCRDYQDSGAFQFYMEGYLEDFLSMAVGDPVGFSWMSDERSRGIAYSSVYGSEEFGYAVDGTRDTLKINRMEEAGQVRGSASVTVTEIEEVSPAPDQTWQIYVGDFIGEGMEGVSGLADQPAEAAHQMLKNSRNLLYRIVYDGKELYTNAEGMELDGAGGILPEGYSFLLYFDGEKVRIVKDGAEQDVYGDGIYREEGGWFVPGYRNFPVDSRYAGAQITIAAIDLPQPEELSAYGGNGGAGSVDRLYRIVCQMEKDRENSVLWCAGLLAAAVLLAFGFRLRQARAELGRRAACFTGRIWYEGKLIWLAGCLYGMYCLLAPVGYSWLFDGWREGVKELLAQKEELFPFLVLLWLLLLLVNDGHYHPKSWKHSLTALLLGSLSRRGMKLSFQQKMTGRLRLLWLSTAAEALILALAAGLIWENVLLLPGGTGLVCAAAILILGLNLCIHFYFTRQIRRVCEDMGKLIDQTAAVRNGDMETDTLLPQNSDLRRASVNLTEIRDGMRDAVEEQVKSERMKVELIANVSHDIKTPLTSIISYVDLLKEEDGLPEHVKDYIAILDGKAHRLKTMVQDVFEVSKAASGQLPVNPERLDCARLLRQTLADMEEQISAAPVTVRMRMPKEEAMILADGQRMYRVFQNLIQNALKYSLPGSRVYVSLTQKEGAVTASVSNTSAMELSADIDYTARFTRGDDSRTDGGSGLGLSIARSFTEACGGEFSIRIQADLFTAEVTFQADSSTPRTET